MVQPQYSGGDDGAPEIETEPDENDPPKKNRYISQHNMDAIKRCMDQLQEFEKKYTVTPIGGPCLNACQALSLISLGQLLSEGTGFYNAAWTFFDTKFAEQGEGSQGGIPAAIEAIVAEGGLKVNGQRVPTSKDELKSGMNEQYNRVLQTRGEANFSLEFHYDER